MTNPKALKEVYVALGGEEADVAGVSTNEEMIRKIAEVATGGGAGGSMRATLSMTVDPNTGTISFGTCSKNGNELKEALTSGVYPYIEVSLYMGDVLAGITVASPCGYQTENASDYITLFLLYDASSQAFKTIMVYPDGHAVLADE
jgi:hypothetical protein